MRSKAFLLGLAAGLLPAVATFAQTPVAANSLVQTLSATDPAAREKAIRGIIADRANQQQPVAEALITGDLHLRMNALEILKTWNAPIDGIDPWQPDTLTSERIARLKQWETLSPPQPPAVAASQPAPLAETQRQEASVALHRLLTTTSDGERTNITEQLARIGPALLPLITDHLADPALTDPQRRQFTALKYRLFTSDALLEQWHDGPLRITDLDRQIRLTAATELADVATDPDAPLLLQLFSDNDPMIREISLTALKKIDGTHAGAALSQLLDDPEPNVQAAVLKELAENPSPRIAPLVIAYIHREKDPDLLGHAIRVLSNTKAPGAVDCLISLLDYPSWRVRADAIEGLVQAGSAGGTNYVDGKRVVPPDTLKIGEAILKHLHDPDTFVASHAVLAFQTLTPPASAIDALAGIAKSHHELAPDIVKILTNDSDLAAAALPILKGFADDPDPAIREQIIMQLGSSMGLKINTLLQHGLDDLEPRVRIAAETVYRGELWKLLPEDGKVTQPGTWFSAGTSVAVDPQKWLPEFRAGKKRPPWLNQLKPTLDHLADSGMPDEKLAIAPLLLAFSDDPRVENLLANPLPFDKNNFDALLECLPWLAPPQRSVLVPRITALAGSLWERREILRALGRIPDENFLPAIWAGIAADTAFENVDDMQRLLTAHYFGEEWYSTSQASDKIPERKKMVREVLPMAQQGNEPQRAVALAMLASFSMPDAVPVAKHLFEDSSASAASRANAYQVLLLGKPKADAEKFALEGLHDPDQAKIALEFLVNGRRGMETLRGDLRVNVAFDETDFMGNYEAKPHKPLPPAGMTADMIKGLLVSKDVQVRAYASYFLCLLNDRSALPVLKESLKSTTWPDDATQPLLYRALTALNDDSLTPELEKIYASLQKGTGEVRTFYWTIRTIDGPNILKLRKKIRDEVGMQQLQ